jgi:hypothetical protein
VIVVIQTGNIDLRCIYLFSFLFNLISTRMRHRSHVLGTVPHPAIKCVPPSNVARQLTLESRAFARSASSGGRYRKISWDVGIRPEPKRKGKNGSNPQKSTHGMDNRTLRKWQPSCPPQGTRGVSTHDPMQTDLCEPVILAGHRRITLMSAVTGSSALLSRPVHTPRAHPPDNIGRVGGKKKERIKDDSGEGLLRPTKPLDLHCTINREAGKEKKSWRQCRAKALLREFFQTLN